MAPLHEPRLARTAAMIADPARSLMLAHLLGGERASAGELAAAAGVGAPTASAHLAKLLEAGLLAVEPRGRHRYFKLADADVAHALEALALVADRHRHDQAWQAPARHPLRFARCCYGHLAGELGVRLMDSLQARGHLQAAADSLALTPAGQAWLQQLGLGDLPPPRRGQRQAYACLDWSERRDHLAGPLATRLLQHFIAQHWLQPATAPAGRPRNRALQLTPKGQQQLLPLLQASTR
jgi:DNA-binding transcriptional ArsR family regulator